MSEQRADEPLPTYDETTAHATNPNDSYNDHKSPTSTVQQVSTTRDNGRSSRMCEATCLPPAAQLTDRKSVV